MPSKENKAATPSTAPNHGKIVSFRIRTPVYETLIKDLRTTPVEGISSVSQLIRKILLDYAGGRLKYTSADGRKQPPIESLS
jgi:hypothetical protein